ncbi:helix-turn-helix domain-containing protein [Arhodomonas sp. SL1]|uniref:helix-turn-helix domain-containing protein n=1 Tax=Arhodomonas sp. SL1 TaxID=3425691 RepID=UPI003F88435C
MQILFTKAVERGVTITELAEEIDVGTSTLSHLRTGRRQANHLDSSIIERIATWLELPKLAVMILADQVTMADFYVPGRTRLDQIDENITQAIQYIRGDEEWRGFIPRDVDEWRREDQVFVIWCYEQATGTKLIRGDVSYPDLLETMRQYREEHPAESKD